MATLAIVGDGRQLHTGARWTGFAAVTRTRADGAGSMVPNYDRACVSRPGDADQNTGAAYPASYG